MPWISLIFTLIKSFLGRDKKRENEIAGQVALAQLNTERKSHEEEESILQQQGNVDLTAAQRLLTPPELRTSGRHYAGWPVSHPVPSLRKGEKLPE